MLTHQKSGNFMVIKLIAVHRNVDSARYAPTNDSFGSWYSDGVTDQWDC